jgi:hypothetical protein
VTNDVDIRPPAKPDLPADPEAYDSPRARIARAKGLDAAYIAGGLDPDPDGTARDERRYVRLLIIMVVAIVLGGFVMGTAILLVFGTVP